MPLQVRQVRNGLRDSENEYKTANSTPVIASEGNQFLVSASEAKKASANTDMRMRMAATPCRRG